MLELTEIVRTATQRVGGRCFLVPIDGSAPVYRERVYCYELYHQMRCLWPSRSPYSLNGELDKSGHHLLRKRGADYAKPDLLVHQPGDMLGNYAIIEVKTCGASSQAIRSDLTKLALFVTQVGYQRAIYLLYGDSTQVAAERVIRVARGVADVAGVELWLHGDVGQAASFHGRL